MKAKPLLPTSSNARNLGTDKELVDHLLLVWYNPEALHIETIVDARCWMGRAKSASKVYCSIWISDTNDNWSGYATASGYGYHKVSAALAEAIRSAGWKLDRDIGGAGERPMHEALMAIGRQLKGPRAVLEVLQ